MEEQMIESSSKKKGLLASCRENPWIVSTSVLALVVVLLLIPFSSLTGNVVNSEDAGQKLLDLYTSQGITGLSIGSVEEVSGVYEVTFNYNGQEVPVYVTKDAQLVGSLAAFPVAETNSDSTNSNTQTSVPKSDKPVVELFVMTHCPYGTQSEKGFVPFLEAFGNNVDAKIRFVHYFMHGDKEEQETYTQVCIREEQSSKYLTYLREFLVEGNSANALSKANVDATKLTDCIQNRAKNYYAEDSELSKKYGVQGSPTLVINGVVASSGRSASDYLSVACSAFNEAPSKCTSLALDSTSPSAGFGWGTSGSATSAQC